MNWKVAGAVAAVGLVVLAGAVAFARPDAEGFGDRPKPAVSSQPSAVNPFADKSLYVDANRTAQPLSAAAMAQAKHPSATNALLSSVPQAVWLTDTYSTATVGEVASSYVGAAQAAGKYPTLVLFAIPGRDCNGSQVDGSGGIATGDAYKQWIDQVVAGIGNRPVSVIIEPGALALIPADYDGNTYGKCMMDDQQIANRYALIKYAVDAVAGHSNIAAYVDAGHSRWWYPGLPATDYDSFRLENMASRLSKVDVSKIRGFSLNVANYFTTASQEEFGEKLSRLVGGAHYVVDTSRNGLGPALDEDSCNPPGRAIGAQPTSKTKAKHDDAWLWIKRPGESDGQCHQGDPPRGMWFQAMANELVADAPNPAS